MIGSQITKWNKEDDLNILNALKYRVLDRRHNHLVQKQIKMIFLLQYFSLISGH